MQVRMRKIADVVDDHGMMCVPRKIDRYAGPVVGAFEFGNLRHGRTFRERWLARKNPDQSVTRTDRKRTDLDLAELTAEHLVWHLDESAVPVVGPAVVGAGQRAVFDLADRQFDVPM